jgi:hypothetical protein
MVRHCPQESLNQLNRVVVYMVICPFVCLLLSLPLAAGRMSSVRSQQGLLRGSWVVDGTIGFGRRTPERFD